MINRRKFVNSAAAATVLGTVGTSLSRDAIAQSGNYRIGLMLPSSGTFAVVGNAVLNGFKLAMAEYGGKLGGRNVEIFTVDDESDPAKATENANRLVKRDKVEVLVGSVHSGVALAMTKVARDNKTLLIVPNAGADEITGAMCAPNIFRTSYSNWQAAHAAGRLLRDRKHKNVVTLAWKYTTGEQMINGFKDAFLQSGGSVLKELYLPFPNVEFQPYLTEIASLRPDAVYVFVAGAGAVKFVKDYAAAGLKKIPLYAPGFLTDGLLDAMGESADGIYTTLHYADGLGTPRDNAFRKAYKAAYKEDPDVFAVQGYDTAQLLQSGLTAVKGNSTDQAALIKAMEAARIDSPRGVFTMSRSHNPIQDIYVRQVKGGQNKYVEVASKALADPGTGCRI